MIKEQEEIENREIDPIEKELNGHEQKYGIRPDFLHQGRPGFYARDEKEWFNNMKAARQRLRFSTDGKISQFRQKHPHETVFIRNPNKEKDFVYPINRKRK